MNKIIKTLCYFLVVSLTLSACYYDEVVGFVGLPTNVSFKNDVQPILSTNCTYSGCHDANGSHSPSLVSENSYNALIQGGFVNTIEPEKSHLYSEITVGGMPPSGPLTVNEKKIILAWITEGAKNN